MKNKLEIGPFFNSHSIKSNKINNENLKQKENGPIFYDERISRKKYLLNLILVNLILSKKF
jgi:hypothetical protein